MDPDSPMVGTISGPAHYERASGVPGTNDFGAGFDNVFTDRQKEATEFYESRIPKGMSDDAQHVMRQAYSGMLWNKQFYHYDVYTWLEGDPAEPEPPPERLHGRNKDWTHLYNDDVISMPDKWEYPWYAAWDLAFHCIPLAIIDPDYAKEQLLLLLREWYMHPNGQLPAYEWAFGDVNPPVHAWAAWRVYKIERRMRGVADRSFLEKVFHKLLLNFTWWVNRKDPEGHNIFQGGFLGLDNIGLFDRSAPLPTGGHLEQSDGTSWMGMYCLNMLSISLELAKDDHAYEDVASKFFEHFVSIARGLRRLLSLANRKQLKRILCRMLDETEFLSPHGIRALSRFHLDHPYEVQVNGHTSKVDYEPAESSTEVFGGNSNWRGPIWFPVNYLLIESLPKYHHYFGEDFKIECPTHSRNEQDLWQVAQEISKRLTRIFVRGKDGKRPFAGGQEIFNNDPHWRGPLFFFSYFFCGDGARLWPHPPQGGAGVGAKTFEPGGATKFFASSPHQFLRRTPVTM